MAEEIFKIIIYVEKNRIYSSGSVLIFKIIIYVEKNRIYSSGSVLSAVSFTNDGYIAKGPVYFEVRNEIYSAFRLFFLSKDTDLGQDNAAVTVFHTSLSKHNFTSRSDNHY